MLAAAVKELKEELAALKAHLKLVVCFLLTNSATLFEIAQSDWLVSGL